MKDHKVKIKKIIKNEKKKLIMIINNDNNNELELIYQKYNGEKYDPIIIEIKKIKNEINKLKNYHEIVSPKNIKLLSNIVEDSFACIDLGNQFTVFTSINDILYLIYTNRNNSIICYDLIEQNKIIELKKLIIKLLQTLIII